MRLDQSLSLSGLTLSWVPSGGEQHPNPYPLGARCISSCGHRCPQHAQCPLGTEWPSWEALVCMNGVFAVSWPVSVRRNLEAVQAGGFTRACPPCDHPGSRSCQHFAFSLAPFLALGAISVQDPPGEGLTEHSAVWGTREGPVLCCPATPTWPGDAFSSVVGRDTSSPPVCLEEELGWAWVFAFDGPPQLCLFQL